MGEVVRLAAVREARAEPMLSKRQVAERYGVSVRTVSRWMQRGVPYSKPYAGGSVRFRAVEVDAWLRRPGARAGATPWALGHATARQVPKAAVTPAPTVAATREHAAPEAFERPSRATPTQSQGSQQQDQPPAATVAPGSAPSEPWVDVAAITKHLGITPRALYDLVFPQRGRPCIPHHRDERGGLLFKISEVDKWMDRSDR